VLFAHVVQRPDDDIELDVACLLVGDWDHDIDVEGYRKQLDQFALAAERRKGEREGEPFAVVRALNRTLFGDLGFRGNEEDYYDPRNSFLHQVIDRRVGIPITLSVVYMEVARRIGAEVGGVAFPGHFLLRYDEGDQFLIFDAFHMGLSLDYDDLRQRLSKTRRPDKKEKLELSDEMLEPTSKRQILSRILANLAAIYHRGGDPVRCVEVLERMLILEPDSDPLARELERMRRRVRELN
jgi:regulator of sirC expression with transglutaminase-like and TPR domain